MTKNNNLFNIVNVKFDADEAHSLIGKNVFVSDSLINIRDAVNEMRTDNPCYYGRLISAQTSYSARGSSFKIDCDDRTFKYVYYDPYYELKCALICLGIQWIEDEALSKFRRVDMRGGGHRMTARICDRCGKQIQYTDGYTLHVCFDMETVLERDVCKDCRKRFMADMDAFFQVPSLSYHSNEKEEKHVGD